MANGKGYTYQWKIGNLTHCYLKSGERLESPSFIADALGGTKYSLCLYPRGTEDETFVECYLHREKDCSVTEKFRVYYQLAFLDREGTILSEGTKSIWALEKDANFFYPASKEREIVFFTERHKYLPEDTLTVQCVVWDNGEKPAGTKHLYARTVYKVNRRSFVWKIDKFSTLNSRLRNKFKDTSNEFELVLNERKHFEKTLAININSLEQRLKYFSFKISVVDSAGKKENCGNHIYFADDLKTDVSCTLFCLKKLTENNSQYLPNDVLTLSCEYVYSTGDTLHEFSNSGIIYSEIMNEAVESKNENNAGEQESLNEEMPDSDFKSMYDDAILSDTELRTSTQTFPVHKCILSARSPVFRSMFSNDMKEKNCGYVLITDFEDNTVHRMLLYMYTNSLESLDIEHASKLYMIAEKYQIQSLKKRCSSFLKDNLCPTNVCDVLVLADLHSDDDLKSAVQGYILGQNKQFFCSQEWRDFINTHSKLASDIMLRKICEE